MTADDNWPLLNLDTDEALNLRSRLYAHARRRGDLPQDEIKKQVDQLLSAYSISGKGIQRFFSELRGETVAAPLALVPATAHYSMQKVIEALGLGKEQIKMIPVDSHFRADVGALREILLRCANERRPVLALVSVLGSTEEGAIDQIHRLVELQAEMRTRGLAFYHHCDAAWGGYIRTLFFDREGKPVKTPSAIREITQTWPSDEVFQSFSAVHHADSVTIDPHKLGYVPYSCGAIVFRREEVKELITTEAPYIFDGEETRPPVHWPAHPGRLQAGRGGRGLLVRAPRRPARSERLRIAHRRQHPQREELCYRLGQELAPELAREGIILRILTQPPDTNIFCFVVNRAGNTSLKEMNRINQAIYDELKFNPESVIQRHNFIISSTALTFAQYGPKGSQRISCLDEHLAALGIPAEEFEKVGSVKTLRSAVTSPWLALSRGGNPDYSAAFAAVLKQAIRSSVSG